MKIVALTGSIGVGKTTTAAMFSDHGIPIWDADAAVHRLYGVNGAATLLLKPIFPDAIAPDGSIDRARLSKLVIGQPEKLAQLEAIVHPLVGQDRGEFLANARLEQQPLVIVDVPLLFETGGEKYVDAVIVVSCDAALQRARVLARANMTEEKLAAILARQMPDEEKRPRADYLITTDIGVEDTKAQVVKILKALIAHDDGDAQNA